MRVTLAFAVLCLVYLTEARIECDNAAECGDVLGRTVCWSHQCHKNIPCNKDDDCFFYGSANVPRFRCFIVPEVTWPEGYGTCVEERIGAPKYDPLPDADPNAVRF